MQQFYSKNLETMYTPINREILKMKYILYYEILCIYFKKPFRFICVTGNILMTLLSEIKKKHSAKFYAIAYLTQTHTHTLSILYAYMKG